ncbi:hypothetical protein NXF25_008607 [Crotalus adamanteus]|uniref:Retrotransposon gag domain-containing protein n=1 Tax=Crotalus adamanteus TaxID=8729 RepID=A0AAW1BNY6_CROAD
MGDLQPAPPNRFWGCLLVQDDHEPPSLKPTFDGQLEKVAYFLNQVWIYLVQHEAAFLDEVAYVNAVTANLEGDATEWMVMLHDEGTLELGNIDTFLEGLWARFWDLTQACWVESNICSIRQGNQSVAEYIKEFHSIAGRLRR